MTPEQEEIDSQHGLLQTHRRSLAFYKKQLAMTGVAFVQPSVLHGIWWTCGEIRHIKEVLRGWGLSVIDHPDDDTDIQLTSDTPELASKLRRYKQAMYDFEELEKNTMRYDGKLRTIFKTSTISEL